MNHIEIIKIPDSPIKVFWFALKELIKQNLGEMLLVCGSLVFLFLSIWFGLLLPFTAPFLPISVFGAMAYLFHNAQTESFGKTFIKSWRAILFFTVRHLLVAIPISIWLIICIINNFPIFYFDFFGLKANMMTMIFLAVITVEVVFLMLIGNIPKLIRFSHQFFEYYLIVKGKYPKITHSEKDLWFGLNKQSQKDFIEMYEKNKAHYRFYYVLYFVTGILTMKAIDFVGENIILCTLLVCINIILPNYYHYTLCELAINKKQLTKRIPVRIAQMGLS